MVRALGEFWLELRSRARDAMWIGDVLEERFVIRRPAGRGGMGTVFNAQDRETGRAVAVKWMDSVGEDLEHRFSVEGSVLARTNHPAIVRYLASGQTAHGERYLVTEWLQGEDLAARLARGPVPLVDALQILERAADALAHTHGLGIAHRDVKPSNLFLVRGDASQTKIIDFGIARDVHGDSMVTSAGMLLGTVGYLAPEQALNPELVDLRSDAFSLGCVFFEMLTGERPFTGPNPVAVLSKLLTSDVPRPSALRPSLPSAADAIVRELTARDPENRPRDIAAIARRAAALCDSCRAARAGPAELTPYSKHGA